MVSRFFELMTLPLKIFKFSFSKSSGWTVRQENLKNLNFKIFKGSVISSKNLETIKCCLNFKSLQVLIFDGFKIDTFQKSDHYQNLKTRINRSEPVSGRVRTSFWTEPVSGPNQFFTDSNQVWTSYWTIPVSGSVRTSLGPIFGPNQF